LSEAAHITFFHVIDSTHAHKCHSYATTMIPEKSLDPPSTKLSLRALRRKASENTTKLKSDVKDEAVVPREDERDPDTGVHSESSSVASENRTKLKSDVKNEAVVPIDDERDPNTRAHFDSSSAQNYFTRDTSMPPSESPSAKKSPPHPSISCLSSSRTL
jgi:hypothetical protein